MPLPCARDGVAETTQEDVREVPNPITDSSHMRYAILSDVHGNLEALEVVLADILARSPEGIVCLGDFVGYGPDPNECVETLRPHLVGAVAGNHDLAALGEVDIATFNSFAQAAILWTRDQLTVPVRAYLEGLPRQIVPNGFVAVHGSVRDPVEEYILDPATAAANFQAADFHLCVVGHSHVPAVFVAEEGRVSGVPLPPDRPLHLDEGRRYIVNVGSVGQPRDGDPRAAYLWYDGAAQVASLIRLEYPLEVTQTKMMKAGLPSMLAERLAVGR